MKLIENKKLFGKVNIVDILLVLIVLVVGLVAYKKIFSSESSISIGAKFYKTNFVMRVDSVPTNLINYLEEGSEVYDNESNVYIGKLLSFYSGDYEVECADRENDTYVKTTVPNKNSVYLKVEAEVADNPGDLITANNYYVKVGKYLSVRAKNFAGSGYIIEVDRIEELDKENQAKSSEPEDKMFTYYVTINDIAETSKKAIKAGDEVYDKSSGAYLGKIVDAEFTPCMRQLDTHKGEIIEAEVPDRIDVVLKITVEGQIKNGEYLANGITRIIAGGFRTLKTDYVMFSGMITDIEK